MIERPIIFNSESVRAILDGQKTMTRRVVKFTKKIPADMMNDQAEFYCLYGKYGDRLWVKEALRSEYTTVDDDTPGGELAIYMVDDAVVSRDGKPAAYEWERSVLPAIFMPLWASRITLEIVSVKVERLQEISKEDAIAEGLKPYGWGHDDGTIQRCFAEKWDAINARRGYSWVTNPWVWVIEFKAAT